MPSTNEIIDVNPFYDLVTFDDIPANYIPGQDIFVIYQLGEGFKATSKDWVGLYPVGWSGIHQYLAFHWSSKKPRNPKFPQIRSALFLAKDISHVTSKDGNELFQFLYVHKGNHIVGVSRRFTISTNPEPQLLRCVDRKDKSFGSLTFIEVASGKGRPVEKPWLDGYDVLDDEETTPLLRDEDENRAVPLQTTPDDDWLTPISTRKLKEPEITFTIPDHVYEQMKAVLSQICNQQIAAIDRPLSAAAPPKCKFCKQCRHQVTQIESANHRLTAECHDAQEELRKNKDVLEMKEWLVTALSDQVKNLVSENSILHAMKEKYESAPKQPKMCKRCSRLWSKLANIQTENQRLKQELIIATSDLQKYQEERAKNDARAKESEEKLRRKCSELEEDLLKLTNTLPGNCATWRVVPLSRRSQSVQETSVLNDKVKELEENIRAMTSDIQETRDQFQDKQTELENLIKRRDELMKENDVLTQRVEQLEHGLSAEQRRRCDQSKKHKITEEDLNERIRSLTRALESAHVTRRSSTTDTASQSQTTVTSDAQTDADIPDLSFASSFSDDDFSFNKFISQGMEAIGKQFDDSIEADKPLIEVIDQQPHTSEFLPPPMFDFYPTALPDPVSHASNWLQGLFATPPNPSSQFVELDEISLGNACNKQKVVFDFRNDEHTKDVIDASAGPNEVVDQPTPANNDVEAQVEFRPKWQKKTAEAKDTTSASKDTGTKVKVVNEKQRFKVRKPVRPKRLSKLASESEKPRPTKSRARKDDANIICPYCNFVFDESANLTTISRHIERHNK